MTMAPTVTKQARGSAPVGMRPMANAATRLVSMALLMLAAFTGMVAAEQAMEPVIGKIVTTFEKPAEIAVSPAELPPGTQGRPFPAMQVEGSGGAEPYKIEITKGALPPGLAMSDSGEISGVPTATGGPFKFTVTATDKDKATGSRDYEISVSAIPKIAVSPAELPPGTQGRPFPAMQVSASGGTAPYKIEITKGALPPGLAMSDSGEIGGVPTATGGPFKFTIRATDKNRFDGAREYEISISAIPKIAVSPAELPPGTQGRPFPAMKVEGSGGTAPYKIEITKGALPPGLDLSDEDEITGVPTASGGPFKFTVSATDAKGFDGAKEYSITIKPLVEISLSPGALPGGTTGSAYPNTQLFGNGGTGPYRFILAGKLPPGLDLSSTGLVSGVPSQAGTFPVVVGVQDANKSEATKTYSITIAPAPVALPPQTATPAGSQISIGPSEVPGGNFDVNYPDIQFVGNGGTGPYLFSVPPGTLPPGLNLTASGRLTGVPIQAGAFAFEVTATDRENLQGKRNYSITVASAGPSGPACLPGFKPLGGSCVSDGLPPPITSGTTPRAPQGDLATLLQIELERLDCYTGAIDGDWGQGSISALERFDDRARRNLGSQPSQAALNATRATKGKGYCAPVYAAPPVYTPPTVTTTTTTNKPRCSGIKYASTDRNNRNTCKCSGGRTFENNKCVDKRKKDYPIECPHDYDLINGKCVLVKQEQPKPKTPTLTDVIQGIAKGVCQAREQECAGKDNRYWDADACKCRKYD